MPPMSGMARPHMRGPTNVDDILAEIAQDRVEVMSTISESDMSEIPDDVSTSGVFKSVATAGKGPKVINKAPAGNKRTINII